MNDTTTTEFVWRRFEEPVRLFGWTLPPTAWFFIMGAVLVVGLFYVGWMYVRDSKGIGPWWATFLGVLRTIVYIVLALVFALPSEQTWYESRQRSKVIFMVDVSYSLGSRDELPGPGQTFSEMPTRMDKVLNLLDSKDVRFMDRLLEKNPVTGYRLARGLDIDYRYFQREKDESKFFTRAEREKIVAAGRSPSESLPPGYALDPEHWRTFLQLRNSRDEENKRDVVLPLIDETLPRGWGKDEARAAEFLRQVRENQTKVSTRFYEASAIGEALLDVIKQERNNMIEGIVLFTDGRLTDGSFASVREAAAAANDDPKIPIFVVAVGETRPKVAIDIVDIGAPPLIRPDDKFKVLITVNGQDMEPGLDTFDIFLDVTRFKRLPDGKLEFLNLEYVPLDEKGQPIKDAKPVPMKQKITLDTRFIKDLDPALKKPVFKAGNPPTCQVEFELDAATLARAAGITLKENEKIGLAPSTDAELRFQARIPKDKREITARTEHQSDTADMRVQEKPLRVLLFASAANRDFQFLRTLLVREEEKQRAQICICLQQIPEGEKRAGIVQDIPQERMLSYFPTKRALSKEDKEPYYALSYYDVIISFDANWDELSLDQARNFNDWIYKDGGGLVFIAGEMNTKPLFDPRVNPVSKDWVKEYNERTLKKFQYLTGMLPVVPEFGSKVVQEPDKEHRLTFPKATSDMEFMRIDESLPRAEWKKGWDRFFYEKQDEDGKTEMSPTLERGFFTFFPLESVKNNALNIAAIALEGDEANTGADKRSFLSIGPWGAGKVAWLGCDSTWRLRMYKEAYHERFWTKLMAEVGSKSANTLNKRITPIMNRYGSVNKPQPFEVRFENINGDPLRRDVKPKPRLEIVLPTGVSPQKDSLVRIRAPQETDKPKNEEAFKKQKELAGKQGKVAEVKVSRDAGGAETRSLVVTVFLDDQKKQATSLELDITQVDMITEPIEFEPRLGTAKDETLEKKNDGWFKAQFQPRAAGEYKLKVVYDDSPDNFYNHKFLVRDTNPETDNVKPDPEVLWELASPAKRVLDRIENLETKAKVRAALKRPEGLKKADAGKKPAGEADDGTKLYFDLDSAKLIPDCMTQRKKDVRNRGKIEDKWDDGFWKVETESGEKKPVMPYVLLICVGLLSVEWLTRKLLRLA